MKNQALTLEVQNDFVHQSVPLNMRRNWLRLFSIWAGFILVVGVMAIGGGLAGGMKFPELMTAILLGNFLLGLLAAFSGYVGAKSGKSFAQLCQNVFPNKSGKIVTLYAPFTLVAWYAIESSIFGGMLGHVFNLGPILSQCAMAASAAVFCITAYIGFRGIQWLSVVLVPTVIVLGSYAIFYVLTTGSGQFGFSPEPIAFNKALGLVIGSWVLGVVAAYPDIARFAKTPATGAFLGFIGIFLFNSLNFFVGAAGAALSQQFNPALILLSAGVPLLAVIMGIGNVWTTNDANLYSASLGVSHAFPISRRQGVLICAVISVVMAFFNPADFTYFFKFLLVLSATAPALGGVVLGGYFVTKDGQQTAPAIAAWGGWLIGSLVGYYIEGMFSVPAGVATGFLSWVFLRSVANRISKKNR